MISTLKERYTIKLIFIFISDLKEKRFISKFRLSFQNAIQNIESNEIEFDIPKELFKFGRDKIVISIDLYENNLSSQISQSYIYKFNVYKGENKAYVFTDSWNCKVFEVIFKNLESLTILKGHMKFSQLDSLDNKYRKRLTLINCGNTAFQINKKIYDFANIIYKNYEINDNLPESYQISIEDLSEKIFIIKPLSEPKELDLSYIKDNKENFRNIMNNLENILVDERNYLLNYHNKQYINEIELLIKKDAKIIKRLGFKNNDNLLEDIENKFNEKNLSEKDLQDLNYLYSKFLVNY